MLTTHSFHNIFLVKNRNYTNVYRVIPFNKIIPPVVLLGIKFTLIYLYKELKCVKIDTKLSILFVSSGEIGIKSQGKNYDQLCLYTSLHCLVSLDKKQKQQQKIK